MASTEVEQKEGSESQEEASTSNEATKKKDSKLTQEELAKMAKEYSQYLVVANHPEVSSFCIVIPLLPYNLL